MQRTLRVVTLTLVALAMGMSFAHVLEWPAKLNYDASFYVRVQTSLYALWGPASRQLAKPFSTPQALG
jgi:hypothetical protein